MKTQSCLFSLLVATAVTSCFGEELSGLAVVDRQEIYSIDDQTPPPHNEVHFPYLYEASDGTWYMTHREGPHYTAVKMFGLSYDDPRANLTTDDRVQTVMSTDRGHTWQPWPGLPHRERHLRLSITELSDGSLISYICKFANLEQDGTALAPVLRSHDDGATWTKHLAPVSSLPSDIGPYCGMWGSIVEVVDDDPSQQRLVATCYAQQKSAQDSQQQRFVLLLVESLDGGDHWQYVSTIANSDVPGEEGPNEADLVYLGGGELYAVFRTGDKEGSQMHECRSTDWGQTWSKPEPFPGGEAGVSPQLVLMPTGKLVICFGRRISDDRALIARVSIDGGRSWNPPLRIYEGSGKVYADLQVLQPNLLRVVYDESPVEQPDGSETNAIVRVVLQVDDGS